MYTCHCLVPMTSSKAHDGTIRDSIRAFRRACDTHALSPWLIMARRVESSKAPDYDYTNPALIPSWEEFEAAAAEGRYVGLMPSSIGCIVIDIDSGPGEILMGDARPIVEYPTTRGMHAWFADTPGVRRARGISYRGWVKADVLGEGNFVIIHDWVRFVAAIEEWLPTGVAGRVGYRVPADLAERLDEARGDSMQPADGPESKRGARRRFEKGERKRRRKRRLVKDSDMVVHRELGYWGTVTTDPKECHVGTRNNSLYKHAWQLAVRMNAETFDDLVVELTVRCQPFIRKIPSLHGFDEAERCATIRSAAKARWVYLYGVGAESGRVVRREKDPQEEESTEAGSGTSRRRRSRSGDIAISDRPDSKARRLERLAAQVKVLRAERGMTLVQTADVCGVSVRQVRYVESVWLGGTLKFAATDARNAERDLRIRELRAMGLSQKEIAEMVGCTQPIVHQVLNPDCCRRRSRAVAKSYDKQTDNSLARVRTGGGGGGAKKENSDSAESSRGGEVGDGFPVLSDGSPALSDSEKERKTSGVHVSETEQNAAGDRTRILFGGVSGTERFPKLSNPPPTHTHKDPPPRAAAESQGLDGKACPNPLPDRADSRLRGKVHPKDTPKPPPEIETTENPRRRRPRLTTAGCYEAIRRIGRYEEGGLRHPTIIRMFARIVFDVLLGIPPSELRGREIDRASIVRSARRVLEALGDRSLLDSIDSVVDATAQAFEQIEPELQNSAFEYWGERNDHRT